jgi:SpoVK/Ycf46/Vps4 family AAA+-type ATPase
LEDQFEAANEPAPPKLDFRCIDLSFREMRQEGFADDGLFDRMKTFFLPLTTVEQDLKLSNSRWSVIAAKRNAEKNQLENERLSVIHDLEIVEDEYYRYDDLMTATTRGGNQQGATFQRQISEYRQEREKLEPRRSELRSRLNQIDDMLENITKAIDERIRDSGGRDLIKPNRGFIMYGPPGKLTKQTVSSAHNKLLIINILFSLGTGKSDIMSNLSKRMGITMVAPPLAAGELNRSLVGESERIINDICMRCHRIPYLMCCISIDEIDSLAPKRTNDTSDGNVAKLSVLLSVIDGIKDVPNLMIFCATNRLNMMDEAFLRRMQGKFFVGRPSSQARKSILSSIKTWHMGPDLLENLTMATTNFSGAALR